MTKSLNDLSHTVVDLPNGGFVLVLDTGAVISPEAGAMIQALHSRSTGGVWSHLEKLAERGSDKFMSSFYVGYGHKSIGDCGSTTIFIEGISMLAAKAVQDWPLYSGQEASTRYVDYAKQAFLDPLESDASSAFLETWRTFYLDAQEPLRAYLKEQFPIGEGEKEGVYEKAINARSFDILRGFLPSGAATNIAWHTNLRQAADKVMLMRHHPLQEVRDIAEAIDKALVAAFPSSFGHKHYETTETYNAEWSKTHTYFTMDDPADFAIEHDGVDRDLLASWSDVLRVRPAKTEPPKALSITGSIRAQFMLDFGSYRDLQRHRAFTQRMPLVTTKHGFHPWYLESLPESLRAQAEALITTQEEQLQTFNLDPETAQYYIAMGYNLPNRISGNLAALVYMVELRATRFVHPTLRARAAQLAHELQDRFGEYGLVIHLDKDADRFDVKRGEHDIVDNAA